MVGRELKEKSKTVISAPEEFFQRVHEKFLTADKSSNEPKIVTLKVGDKIIRLHFASRALIPVITPALQHLNSPNSSYNADLDVYLWDSNSTGIPMVQRPWDDNAFSHKGIIKGFNTETIKTVYQTDRDILSILNLKTNKAIYWTSDVRTVPYFETGAPLLGILPQWFLENDNLFVHGGAIGVENKGILIVGPGGSGKSTTTLRCLNNQSLYYLADDYCLLDLNDSIQVHSIYCSGKLDPVQLSSFSFLKSAIYNPNSLHEEKALFFLHPLFAHRLMKTVPLKAIFIPQITSKGKTYISPASPVEAFKALAPSTLFQLPGFDHKASKMIAKLIKKVPIYHLKLGDDSKRVPEVIHNYLVKLT